MMQLLSVMMMTVATTVAACQAQPGDAAPPAAPPPDEQREPVDAPVPPPDDAAEATAAPQVERLLERIEERSGELRSLRARLRYDRIDALLGDEQRRFGTLVYDAGPPARFAVHLDRLLVDAGGDRMRAQPQNRWYIFDGRWLLERNHDDKVAIRRQVVPPDEDAAAVDPLGMGQGPFAIPLRATKADILRRFEVQLLDAEGNATDADDSHRLRLTPRPGTKIDARHVDLTYDPQTLLPTRARTVETNGNESIIDLMEIETNVEIDDASFDTTPPDERGWTVDVQPWE